MFCDNPGPGSRLPKPGPGPGVPPLLPSAPIYRRPDVISDQNQFTHWAEVAVNCGSGNLAGARHVIRGRLLVGI